MINVRLFARLRELAGRELIEIDLPAGATVAELRRKLAADCPALKGMLDRCAVAVNEEFAENDLTLPLGAEVAVLPPVSGG
jgi:molybdopterin converting factor subunit 1